MNCIIGILLQIPTEPATPSATMDFSWLFIKMLLMLGVVSLLAVVLIKYVMPRIGIIKRLGVSRSMQVLERFPLEPRKSLYLLRIGEKYLVIGVSDNAINVVTELSRKEALGDHEGRP